MFINRDWNRKENDDFQLNVEPHLTTYIWATPQYHNSTVIGWVVKNAFE